MPVGRGVAVRAAGPAAGEAQLPQERTQGAQRRAQQRHLPPPGPAANGKAARGLAGFALVPLHRGGQAAGGRVQRPPSPHPRKPEVERRGALSVTKAVRACPSRWLCGAELPAGGVGSVVLALAEGPGAAVTGEHSRRPSRCEKPVWAAACSPPAAAQADFRGFLEPTRDSQNRRRCKPAAGTRLAFRKDRELCVAET